MHAVAPKRPPEEIEQMHAEMERKQKEQDSFVMPVTMDGDPVVFYEHGVRTGRQSIAFVQKRNAKGVELRLSNGLVKPNVPHVDDPRLKYSHEMRADWGAWDETRRQKEIDERFAKLEARTVELETLLNEPAKKK